jgi:hypothetical protein
VQRGVRPGSEETDDCTFEMKRRRDDGAADDCTFEMKRRRDDVVWSCSANALFSSSKIL